MGLTRKEKAYILDQIGRASYFEDEFGQLNNLEEERLIRSIFLKMQEIEAE